MKSSGRAGRASAFCCREDTNVDGVHPEGQTSLWFKSTSAHAACGPGGSSPVSLTFFAANSVEITSREPSSEGSVEPLVSSLLILHRLFVEWNRLLQWLIYDTHHVS